MPPPATAETRRKVRRSRSVVDMGPPTYADADFLAENVVVTIRILTLGADL
jgi:hypothetical protein